MGSGAPLGCSQKVKGSRGTRDVPITVRDLMGDGSNATGQRTVPIAHRAPGPRQSPLLRRAASQRIEKPSPSRSAQPRPRATAKDRFKFTPQWAQPPHSRDHAAVGVVVSTRSCRYPEHDAEPRHVIHRTYVIELINVQSPPEPWFTFTQRICRDEVPVSGNAFLLPPSQR